MHQVLAVVRHRWCRRTSDTSRKAGLSIAAAGTFGPDAPAAQALALVFKG
jgi:hypothetical protein